MVELASVTPICLHVRVQHLGQAQHVRYSTRQRRRQPPPLLDVGSQLSLILTRIRIYTLSICTAVGCTSTTCANGGTCYPNGNSFVCMCPYPWGGAVCTTNVETGAVITTTTTTVRPGVTVPPVTPVTPVTPGRVETPNVSLSPSPWRFSRNVSNSMS